MVVETTRDRTDYMYMCNIMSAVPRLGGRGGGGRPQHFLIFFSKYRLQSIGAILDDQIYAS